MRQVFLTMIFVYIKAVNVLTQLDRQDCFERAPHAHAFETHAQKQNTPAKLS